MSPPRALLHTEVLDNLLRLENRVMDYWNVKKRRLDWCQQYVLVERSARQALDWIKDTGERWESGEGAQTDVIWVLPRTAFTYWE